MNFRKFLPSFDGSLDPAALAVPLVALLLYGKASAFNAQISPGGFNLPQAHVAMAALAMLLAGAVWLVPSRFRLLALLALDLIGSAIVLADVLYLRYFGEILPASAALHGLQALEVKRSVGALLKPEDLMLFLDAIALAALWPLRRRRVPCPRLPSRALIRGALTLALVFPAWQLHGVLDDFERHHPNALSGAWNPRYIAASIGTTTYHLVDGYHTAVTRFEPGAGDDEVETIASWLAEKNAPRPIGRGFAIAEGKNLIVVQVEALQGFTMARTIEGREVTPHLNRLARESLYFPGVYGQTKDGNTSDSEFIVNTGLYPAPRGAAFVRFAGNAYQALPQALADRGYATVAMHANAPGFWNRYAMYGRLGFSRFESAQDYHIDDHVGLGLSDAAFYKQSLPKLEALPEPFYAWMVTLSSHHPYDEAAQLSDLPVGDLAGTMLGNYMKSIHYADAQLGAFVAELERTGLWDRSVLVVLGDHPGIQREDRQALFRLVGEAEDSDLAWRKLQKIPLLIHVPGDAPRGRLETAGGHIDIMPTVANLLGVPAPAAFGQDLLNAVEGFVVFSDASYIAGASYHDPHLGAAYDLATGRALTEGVLREADRAQKHLAYSSAILRGDLLPRIAERTARLPANRPQVQSYLGH